MANQQYKYEFSRHKHSQDIGCKRKKRRTGTRPKHSCHNPNCGCGLFSKKRHKIQLWLWNWMQIGVARPLWTYLNENKPYQEPKLLRIARHWNRKYAYTRWLQRVKRVYEVEPESIGI